MNLDYSVHDMQGTKWFPPNPERQFFPEFWVGTSTYIEGYWLRDAAHPPTLFTGVWDQ